MAFYRTIVARTGFVDEMIAHLGRGSGLVSPSGQWLGPVADDEAGAIQAANEYFEANTAGSVLASDSTDAWEFTDSTGEILLGWKITAEGWFDEDEED